MREKRGMCHSSGMREWIWLLVALAVLIFIAVLLTRYPSRPRLQSLGYGASAATLVYLALANDEKAVVATLYGLAAALFALAAGQTLRRRPGV